MKTFLKTAGGVLFSWKFMLNLLVILIITCWVPLLSQTVEMRDGAGNLMQQATNTFRAYQSWWTVVRLAPGWKGHLNAVGLHLGLCFAITFAVWMVRSYSLRNLPEETVKTSKSDKGQVIQESPERE